jgi:hypothetical protein
MIEDLHICLVGETSENMERSIKFAEILFSKGRKYVSILFGGFNVFNIII